MKEKELFIDLGKEIENSINEIERREKYGKK